MYLYRLTGVYVSIQAYRRVCIYTGLQACMYLYRHTGVYASIQAYRRVCIYTGIQGCMYGRHDSDNSASSYRLVAKYDHCTIIKLRVVQVWLGNGCTGIIHTQGTSSAFTIDKSQFSLNMAQTVTINKIQNVNLLESRSVAKSHLQILGFVLYRKSEVSYCIMI